MIYYPLSTLMLAGIRSILLISSPCDLASFERLLGDGSRWASRCTTRFNRSPRDWPRRFSLVASSSARTTWRWLWATTFFSATDFKTCWLTRPAATLAQPCSPIRSTTRNTYGVVEFDERQRPVSLVEKPPAVRSGFAVTGLYFYDNDVVDIAAGLRPSARGELEITDVNREYLGRDRLHVEVLPPDCHWLDTGTHESLLQAANLVQTVQTQQGAKIGCVEQVAYRQGFITADQLAQLAHDVPNEYGQYLFHLLDTPPEPPACQP